MWCVYHMTSGCEGTSVDAVLLAWGEGNVRMTQCGTLD